MNGESVGNRAGLLSDMYVVHIVSASRPPRRAALFARARNRAEAPVPIQHVCEP